MRTLKLDEKQNETLEQCLSISMKSRSIQNMKKDLSHYGITFKIRESNYANY